MKGEDIIQKKRNAQIAKMCNSSFIEYEEVHFRRGVLAALGWVLDEQGIPLLEDDV